MTYAMKILKALLYLFAVALALVICIYLVMLAINFQDQVPSKAVNRLQEISRSRPSVSDDENAYVYLMGFSVAKNEDPVAWGKKRIVFQRQLLQQPDTEFVSDLPGEEYDPRTSRPESTRVLLETCNKVDRACLRALEEGDQLLTDWLMQEGWLLERYKALLARSIWVETMPFDERMALPKYSDVLNAQTLLFAQAWLVADHGDSASVKALLESDVTFWRQVFMDSDVLISKLIAAAALRRHFNWSNIVLRRLPANIVLDAVPSSWTKPISEKERSMLRCFAGELEFYISVTRRAKLGVTSPLSVPGADSLIEILSWRMLRPLFQLQETINRHAAVLVSLDETLNVPYKQYAQAVERARVIESEGAQIDFPGGAYNPIGKMILKMASGYMTSYAVRVSDVEGVRRMAVLAAEFRGRGVPVEHVSGELLGADIRHPYTGESFTWDQAGQAIVFVGLEPAERGRHLMIY